MARRDIVHVRDASSLTSSVGMVGRGCSILSVVIVAAATS
jgi:hypothetical protein